MKDLVIKLSIIGDGAVGKTSLIRCKEKLEFQNDSKLTIGVDIHCIPFEHKQINGEQPTFLAVDLGGQKRFHFIHDAYIKGVKAAIIVYDLSRYPTFLNIEKWNNLIYNENPDIPIIVVGSKSDLIDDEKRRYYINEFDKIKINFPNMDKILGHHFISSKMELGIEQLFLHCEKIVKNHIETQ